MSLAHDHTSSAAHPRLRTQRDERVINVLLEHEHDRVRVSVHNSRSCIAEEQMRRIFDSLRRDNHAPAPGWGIGLPYVQNVVESHGGSVAVDSAPATGTSFILELPVDCHPCINHGA